jgi:hypothetical protein
VTGAVRDQVLKARRERRQAGRTHLPEHWPARRTHE